LRDVRMMAAPVGDLPAGVAENPAEVHETTAWSIRCFGRGSEPEIVIEAVRNRLRLLPVAGLTIIRRTARKPAYYRMQFSDAAVANNLTGLAKPYIGSLLAAALENPAARFDGVAHRAAFADGEGERFLTIDILAGPSALNHRNGMPVVRYSDQQSVDILTSDHIPEVFISRAAFINPGVFVTRIVPFHNRASRFTASNGVLPIARRFSIYVAHRDDLHPLVPQECFHVTSALIAGPDDAHRDAITGRDLAVATQRGGGNEHGSGAESGGGLEECSTVHRGLECNRIPCGPLSRAPMRMQLHH